MEKVVKSLSVQTLETKKITWSNGVYVDYTLLNGELEKYAFKFRDMYLNFCAALDAEEILNFNFRMREILKKNIKFTNENELINFIDFDQLYGVQSNLLIDHTGKVENQKFNFSSLQSFDTKLDAENFVTKLKTNDKIIVDSYKLDEDYQTTEEWDVDTKYIVNAVIYFKDKDIANEFYGIINSKTYFSHTNVSVFINERI